MLEFDKNILKKTKILTYTFRKEDIDLIKSTIEGNNVEFRVNQENLVVTSNEY